MTSPAPLTTSLVFGVSIGMWSVVVVVVAGAAMVLVVVATTGASVVTGGIDVDVESLAAWDAEHAATTSMTAAPPIVLLVRMGAR